jgi:nucleoside-diphosphate-sugar epimerase
MTILVVGATGATGRLLVAQLVSRGHTVRVIVRSPDTLPPILKYRDHLEVIHANVFDLGEADMARHVNGCDAVASCLGHRITWKGIYGQPRRLVVDATRQLCKGINSHKSGKPVKFVLMGTTAYRNPDLQEPRSLVERGVFALIRLLLPPHVDNEMAADYLRSDVGHKRGPIEWVVVRPDTLVNNDSVTEYEVCSSPTRSPIFNAGKTSRVNVAHFMADLITGNGAWNRWRGQMPVIYNKTQA